MSRIGGGVGGAAIGGIVGNQLAFATAKSGAASILANGGGAAAAGATVGLGTIATGIGVGFAAGLFVVLIYLSIWDREKVIKKTCEVIRKNIDPQYR